MSSTIYPENLDECHALALSVLNSFCGVRFVQLRAARSGQGADALVVERLRIGFHEAHDLRARLGSMDILELRDVIDKCLIVVNDWIGRWLAKGGAIYGKS